MIKLLNDLLLTVALFLSTPQRELLKAHWPMTLTSPEREPLKAHWPMTLTSSQRELLKARICDAASQTTLIHEYSRITISNMYQDVWICEMIKKLKEILNLHPKWNETCIDVATEEICKFIENVCNAIWIFNTVMWNHQILILNNNNVLVNKCKTHLFYYVYGADLMYHLLVK